MKEENEREEREDEKKYLDLFNTCM